MPWPPQYWPVARHLENDWTIIHPQSPELTAHVFEQFLVGGRVTALTLVFGALPVCAVAVN